jgi:hypothetical protein
MKSFAAFFLFLFTASGWAQEPVRKTLNGKVTASISDLDNIYVVNLKTENGTLTQRGGYFSIAAAAGDTLMFSAVHIIGKRVAIGTYDLEKELYFVKVEPMVTQLEEVKVDEYRSISAESLGIVPKGQKKYTPAERKLATATGLSGDTNSGAAAVGMDPLLNWMSGRTAMLKKEAEVEKKELWLKRLTDMFEENYFVETLKIPLEYVDGFRRYLVEDEKFLANIKSKNKTMAAFLLADLAVKYNDIIKVETKTETK